MSTVNDLLAAHIAGLVFCPLPTIAAQLRAWGLAVSEEADQITWTSPWTNIAGGMTTSTDPNNRAVVVAFALVGSGWPRTLPSLIARVNQRWKEFT
jgi:hypothetical protein